MRDENKAGFVVILLLLLIFGGIISGGNFLPHPSSTTVVARPYASWGDATGVDFMAGKNIE